MDFIFVITPIDGSSYGVIDSLFLQEFFDLSQNVHHPCNEEKTELRKD